MRDKEKDIQGEEETFEDIFSSLREKYNLEPFGSEEEKAEPEEEEKVFYNPVEDNEIDDFFKEAEEGYTALYEEVDAKIAGVDDEALKHEAEILGVNFEEPEEETEPEQSEAQEFEDIYSNSEDAEQAEEDAEVPVTEEVAEEMYEEEKPEKKKASFFPKKSDSTGEKIRKIVFIISIIALIVSAGWLINDYLVQPYLISQQNQQVATFIDDAEATPEQVVEKLNNLDEEEKAVTFESLRKSNKDFKAWLAVPGANISLPVVQTTNNSKYLNTGFNGKWLSGGTVFIDYLNKAPFSDMNTVLYGHNMRDGSMFGLIKNYKNINTFKKNPLIYVYTENETYVYKIYSVFLSSLWKKQN